VTLDETQACGAQARRRFERNKLDPTIVLTEVADALERRAPEVLDRVRRAVFDGEPQLKRFDDPDVSKSCRMSFAANVHGALSCLRPGGSVDAPVDALHHAAVWARRRMPLVLLVRGYSLGQCAMWTEVLGAIEERDLPSPTRIEVVARASHAVLTYAGETLVQATAAHDLARAERDESPESRRVGLVEEALSGKDRSVALGYDLSAKHLAFLAWGDAPGAVVAAFRARIQRTTLIVQPGPDLVWGWIGGADELCPRELRWTLHQAVALDACFAFGTLQYGLGGFKTTFEHARLAHRLGVRRERKLTAYKEVALEALCLHDAQRARAFVHEELGSLADSDAKSASHRQTLATYFAKAGNAASCAAELKVHEGTVGYRLKKIEQRLGHPVARRRAELEVALRLARFLND